MALRHPEHDDSNDAVKVTVCEPFANGIGRDVEHSRGRVNEQRRIDYSHDSDYERPVPRPLLSGLLSGLRAIGRESPENAELLGNLEPAIGLEPMTC